MSVVRDTVTDGVRIAALLSSELHGRTDGVLAHVTVTNANPDVEPSVDGARAYDVEYAPAPIVTEPERDVDVLAVTDDVATGEPTRTAAESRRRLGGVHVHPDRVRVEFEAGVDVAVDAAADTRLRARPKATAPPRTLVFVESGAAVKDAADVVGIVVESLLAD